MFVRAVFLGKLLAMRKFREENRLGSKNQIILFYSFLVPCFVFVLLVYIIYTKEKKR